MRLVGLWKSVVVGLFLGGCELLIQGILCMCTLEVCVCGCGSFVLGFRKCFSEVLNIGGV